MSFFTYYNDIPAANNNPSDDQPKMANNTNAIDSILAEDHYSFESAQVKDGQHKFMRLPFTASPGAQTDPASILYTSTGPVTTKSELTYQNQNGIFAASAVKAFCSFVTVVGITAVTPTVKSNISSITSTNSLTARSYSIVLNAGTLTTDNAVVICSINSSSRTVTYSLSAGTLSLTVSTGSGVDTGLIVNVLILQV
jgi:hypothetical protein